MTIVIIVCHIRMPPMVEGDHNVGLSMAEPMVEMVLGEEYKYVSVETSSLGMQPPIKEDRSV